MRAPKSRSEAYRGPACMGTGSPDDAGIGGHQNSPTVADDKDGSRAWRSRRPRHSLGSGSEVGQPRFVLFRPVLGRCRIAVPATWVASQCSGTFSRVIANAVIEVQNVGR